MVILGAVADSDNEQVFKLEGVHSRASALALAPGPIPKRKWEPIDTRKFGYDVTVRPFERSFERTLGEGEGSQESALLGQGYTSASAIFFQQETLLGNPRSVWREIAWLSSL